MACIQVASVLVQVGRVEDVLELGQSIEVKYLGKDKQNFHKISHKACMPIAGSGHSQEATSAGPLKVPR